MGTKLKHSFHFPRTPLLNEIERRCAFPDCAARNQISLTKQEAIEYRGFDCFQCKRRNEDHVRRSELPDFWATASSIAVSQTLISYSPPFRAALSLTTSIEQPQPR